MHLTIHPFAHRNLPSYAGSGRLRALDDFGSNPGQLAAWTFVPAALEGEAAMPLVVVLHGCTQTAAGYDRGSGWSELAEAYGFAVLYPEQQRSNNANVCFNWFEPADTRRGTGEAQSIVDMIESMVARHRIDSDRVYITGLSAGGAMAAVMLALYPNKFAGGAILAGLPHGAAASVQEAFQQMRSPSPNPRTSGSSIRQVARHAGAWPAVSVWHGTADTVVSPSNADAIVRQWLEVHDMVSVQPVKDHVNGHARRVWRDTTGRIVVEDYRISGMGHGTPLETTGECGCGEAGAFMLEAGISATVHSAKTWGLLGRRRTARHVSGPDTTASPPPRSQEIPVEMPTQSSHISRVIEDALRKAGLMR